MAKAAEAAAARRHIQRIAARVWNGTANPDGPGLLERGREYQPFLVEHSSTRAGGPLSSTDPDIDALVINALIRMGRLAGAAADALRDCPDASVRRSAAVLAARAHPVLVALDA